QQIAAFGRRRMVYIKRPTDSLSRRFEMRRQASVCGTALVLAALSAPPMLAHHSASAYDLKNSLTLEATVAEIVFTNPHVMLHFDAKAANGDVQHWAIETYNPSLMRRAGWTTATLKAGDHAMVTPLNPLQAASIRRVRRGHGMSVLIYRERHLTRP